MAEKVVKISENTYVQLGFVGIIIAGVVWITTVYANTVQIMAQQVEYNKTLIDINTRLSRIEGLLLKNEEHK